MGARNLLLKLAALRPDCYGREKSPPEAGRVEAGLGKNVVLKW